MLLLTALLVGILPMGQGSESQAAGETATSKPAATPKPTESPSEQKPVKTAQPEYDGIDYGTANIADQLSNPQTDSDGNTTWSCVYFGNYWQNDTNGDGVADRDDEKEPIKWRVLSVDGDDAFLLADQNLDCQKYNEEYEAITWETCTIRSWLNGYGANSNTCRENYTSDNFLDNAFSASEQAAVKNTTVVNADNLEYDTEGGNDTQDKVYLLSITEVSNSFYGFASEYSAYDRNRRAKNTAYAKTQGAYTSTDTEYEGNGGWWLRSPGDYGNYAWNVDYHGLVNQYGDNVYGSNRVVRPALHLNLLSASGCSYAGTVSSDGTIVVPESPSPAPTSQPVTETPLETTSPSALPKTITITYKAGLGMIETPGVEVAEYGKPFTISQHPYLNQYKYSISYNSNTPPGATAEPMEDMPSRNLFICWNTEADGSGINYYEGDSYHGREDLVLYAQYEEQENHWSHVPECRCKGYTFLGWYTMPEGGEKVDFSRTLTEDIKVYAHWQPDASEIPPSPTAYPVASPNSSAKPNPGIKPVTPTSPTHITQGNSKFPQQIQAQSLTKSYGSKPFSVGAFTSGDGALSYTSSSPKVAAVSSSGIITVKGYGKTVITIRASETGNFLAAEKKITLTVVPKKMTIKKANSPSRRKLYMAWNTDKSVTGYQIQLSTRKNFKMETVQRMYGKKKKSILITGIRSRKTYYVRIRACRKVGKVKYYGAWSDNRAVRIK